MNDLRKGLPLPRRRTFTTGILPSRLARHVLPPVAASF